MAELENGPSPCIALVAGEASGDQLGAALIARLKLRFPQARFVGIGGRLMREQGMDTWWDCEELAVFGLFEVLSHFPRLLKLRGELFDRLLNAQPDVFIGIDAPDFNLGLEIKLRKQQVKTVHYVSPTVWAWREKRVKKISRAADMVLCLFPFEPEFYKGHGVQAEYVGHPLADQIPFDSARSPARKALGMNDDNPLVALLPGSRMGEVNRLSVPMLEAAQVLSRQRPEIQFAAALANEKTLFAFREAMDDVGFNRVTLLEQKAKELMAAADVVCSASGTATLEALLINRPMVVVYRIAGSTYQLAKYLNLVKTRTFALPNILAGEHVVPELIQHEATGERIALEVTHWLDDDAKCSALTRKFSSLHQQLRCDAAEQAASVVSRLIETPAC